MKKQSGTKVGAKSATRRTTPKRIAAKQPNSLSIEVVRFLRMLVYVALVGGLALFYGFLTQDYSAASTLLTGLVAAVPVVVGVTFK